MADALDRARTRRGSPLLLAALLAASLGLRVIYGLWDVEARRYWDERYNYENVASLLASGELRPASGYYSLLSYLPQAGLLAVVDRVSRATGIEALEVTTEDGDLTATAQVLCRLVQAAYGVGLVLVVYLLGRFLFGTGVASLAAALVGLAPFFVRSGAWFKPDGLVALTGLLALYWSLRAAEAPGWGRFCLAGAGVGLAAGSKLTGLGTALPLLLSALALPRRRPQRWALLGAAAVSGAVVFLAANPFWRRNLRAAEGVLRDYEWKAGGATPLSALIEFWGGFVRSLHGWPFAILFWLGVALLLLRIARGRERWERRVSCGVLLVYPLAFSIAYFVRVPYLKGNNLLPILPIVSLLTAWGAVAVWEGLARRVPIAGSAAATRVAASLFVALAGWGGSAFVYRSLVPTTEDAAALFLDGNLALSVEDPRSRLVFQERWEQPVPQWELRERLGDDLTALAVVERLAEVGAERLDRADGEIFFERRLEGESRELYRGRLERLTPDRVARFRPRLFRLRGPALVALAHPWGKRSRRALEVETDPGTPPTASAELPAGLKRNDWISLAVWLPLRQAWLSPEAATLELEGRRLDLYPSSRAGRGYLMITERFRAAEVGAAAGGALRLRPPPGAALVKTPRIDLYRWRGGRKASPRAEPAGRP